MRNSALRLLVETQPSDYFGRDEHESTKLVVSCLWDALVAANLIHADENRDVHRNNVVLHQLLDVFDAGTAHGVPSLVLDTFREVQSDAMVEHCGVTAAECVLKWVARTVEGCATALEGSLNGGMDGVVLRQTLGRSEAAREAALYALSWQDMERSFHQVASAEGASMVSGPMSQAVVQSFKEIEQVASGISVVLKCLLAVVEATGGVWDAAPGDVGRRAQCQNATGSLLRGMLDRCGFAEYLNTDENMGIGERVMGLLMGYLEGRKKGVAEDTDVLALFVYHQPGEQVVESLAAYFPENASDIRVWALAPMLDAARFAGDDVPLHTALVAISSGRLDCRRMPMAYLLALLELGQSALVLSLLYQKWINPTVTEDVLGCIQILMHEELVIECYVHVKQSLRQLQRMGGYSHGGKSSYHIKAKLFWQAMFAAGAARGLLFQLIRLPMVAKDEAYIVEWLRDGDVQTRKALCLYYLLRGRADEATREVRAMHLDEQHEWDARLVQLCELANQNKLIMDADIREDIDVRMPACMRRGDVEEDSPGKASTGGLLFGAPTQRMETDGAGSKQGGTKKSTIGVFEAPAVTRAGVRGRVARSARDHANVHQLDLMLGL